MYGKNHPAKLVKHGENIVLVILNKSSHAQKPVKSLAEVLEIAKGQKNNARLVVHEIMF